MNSKLLLSLSTCFFFILALTGNAQEHHAILKKEIREMGFDSENFIISDSHYNRLSKTHHYYLKQSVQGIPIFNKTGFIILNQDGTLTNASLDFTEELPALAPAFTLSTRESREKVYPDRIEDKSIEKALYFTESGELRPVFYGYSESPESGEHFLRLLDAQSGQYLSVESMTPACHVGPGYMPQRSLQNALPQIAGITEDSSTYLCYRQMTVSPLRASRETIHNPADEVYSPYGWHDTDGNPGIEYTITRGNNTYVFPDRDGNNAPDRDVDGGDSLHFVYPLDLNKDPVNYTDASATNLFVTINTIHDILAHNGFDETSGNFQEMNFTGEGDGSDPVLGHCQSRAGNGPLNNATFFTPPDGEPGVMRMFTWLITENRNKFLRIETPHGMARRYPSSLAEFCPPLQDFPVTAEIAIVEDSVDVSTDGCGGLIDSTSLKGKIAVVTSSDSCTYNEQAHFAQDNGAVGVLYIAKGSRSQNFGEEDSTITIPAVMIDSSLGVLFLNIMDSMVVSFSSPQTVVDGSLDQGVIIHEFGHGLSNRLVGGRMSSWCLRNGEHMGEGWSDILALMLTMEEEDLEDEARVIGAYVSDEHPNSNGLRGKPYTRDMSLNNYTYNDVKSTGGQVHNMGEIWCTMVYDLFLNMIDLYGFDPDLISGNGGNRKALQLLIEGMKQTPCSPGFVDARNGIIAADEVLFDGENKCMIWETFARRGLGANADQGSNDNHADGREDFNLPISCITDVYVEKSMPDFILEGDTIDVEILVEKVSDTDLDAVQVIEEIPEGLEYLEGTADIPVEKQGGNLYFAIDSADLQLNVPMTINFQYVQSQDDDLRKVYIDPMTGESGDYFIYPNRGHAISFLHEGGKDSSLLNLNCGFQIGLSQFISPNFAADKGMDGNILVLEHAYNMDNFGVSYKLRESENADWKDVNEQFVVGDYDYYSSSIANTPGVFTGTKDFHRTAINLDNIPSDSLYLIITQHSLDASHDSTMSYYLEELSVWNTKRLESEICVEYENGSYCQAYQQVIEPLQGPVSTETYVESTRQLEIFPNPASDVINVKIPETSITATAGSVRLTDLQGNVLRKEVLEPGKNMHSMDVRSLTNAVYIITVEQGEKSVSGRFIVQ